MSKTVFIEGDSGAGKSHSEKYLNPKSTFIINVLGKDLPWKGSGKQYISVREDRENGNLLNTKNANIIIDTMKYVSAKRPEIKDLVIDDHTHIYAGYFLKQAAKEEIQIAAGEKPNIYKKFTHIAQFTLDIADTAKSLRDDLVVYIMHHVDNTAEFDSEVTKKAASFGKFVEEKLKGIESQFTVVLYAGKRINKEGQIEGYFKTRDVSTTAKTPEGMFEDDEIPNNLAYVRKCIEKYYNEE